MYEKFLWNQLKNPLLPKYTKIMQQTTSNLLQQYTALQSQMHINPNYMILLLNHVAITSSIHVCIERYVIGYLQNSKVYIFDYIFLKLGHQIKEMKTN